MYSRDKASHTPRLTSRRWHGTRVIEFANTGVRLTWERGGHARAIDIRLQIDFAISFLSSVAVALRVRIAWFERERVLRPHAITDKFLNTRAMHVLLCVKINVSCVGVEK